MKMKFTLPYKAEWGETLCVDLTFDAGDHRNGGTDNQVLQMRTSDGYHWEVETHTREVMNKSRKNYRHLFYYYKVVDGEGKVVRMESLLSPRLYVYDSSKNYLFNDFWIDDAKDVTLGTSGVLPPQKIHFDQWWRVENTPIYDQTVIFKVHAPQLHEGEAIAILGNHPTLGDWNKDHFLLMRPSANNSFILSVNVEPIDKPIEYKYVVVDKDSLRFKRWEFGENRTLGDVRVGKDTVCVEHGGDFRVMQMPEKAQFDFDTYIFDLDGTLLSTLEDLAASCNYALRVNHLPEHSLEDVRMMVGNGVEMLMHRAIGFFADNDELFSKVFRDFRCHYMAHSLDATQPYPGIMDVLSELKARGKNIAVVSNKLDAATKSLCQHFFGDLVDVAVGEREGIKRKPAPDTVNEVLCLLHADRNRTVYIGDSDVDVMTARNSGMPCISVLWGFRDREFLIEHGASIFVGTPSQLL